MYIFLISGLFTLMSLNGEKKVEDKKTSERILNKIKEKKLKKKKRSQMKDPSPIREVICGLKAARPPRTRFRKNRPKFMTLTPIEMSHYDMKTFWHKSC